MVLVTQLHHASRSTLEAHTYEEAAAGKGLSTLSELA